MAAVQTGDTTLNQIQAMLAARDVQHLRPLSTAPTCPEGPVPALQEITFPLPPTLSQPQPKSLHSFMQVLCPSDEGGCCILHL